jgi:hypothetical protein
MLHLPGEATSFASRSAGVPPFVVAIRDPSGGRGEAGRQPEGDLLLDDGVLFKIGTIAA